MSMTGWFPADVKPVRVGVYEFDGGKFPGVWHAYWNGMKWGFLQNTGVYAAYRDRGKLTNARDPRWRGLTAPDHKVAS